jgi:hypothetical protein
MQSPADARRTRPGRRFRAWVLQLGLGSGVAASLLSAPAAQAIPEAEAYKKLQVIPVFVITDPKGVPLPIPREKALVLPLYIESAQANRELAALNKSNPSVKAIVTPVPLNVMNERILELNKQLKDKSKPLVAPVMVTDADRQQAYTLLKAEGLTDQQIQEGLSVPVFFTRPFLTLNTPEGPRGVFFLGYAELQRALSQVPEGDRQKLKPQVADLTVVLQEIIKSPKDNFVIFPTPEYFRLVKESQAKAQPAKP